MNKTGQTTQNLRNLGAVQLTVDAGTVEKTIMHRSIVTLETTTGITNCNGHTTSIRELTAHIIRHNIILSLK